MGSKSPGPSKEQNALAAAQAQAMKDQMAFDKEMFAWYKDYAGRNEKLGLEMFDRQMALADKAEGRADEQWGLYKDTAGKQIRKFSDEVDAYDTSAYRDQLAGRANTDVESALDVGRQNLGRGLAVRGVNMGSAAYLSAMADMDTSGALAKASAATLAQEAAKREGLNLRAQAAGLGSSAGGMAMDLSGQTSGFMGQALGSSQLGLGTMTTGVGVRNQGSQIATGWGSSANSTFNSIAEQNYRRSQSGFGAQLGNALGAMAGGWAAGGFKWPSDRRLKTDITPVGQLDNGLTVYKYRYKAGGPFMIGVMADEVEKVMPNAVAKAAIDGKYDAVNYGAL